MDPLSNIHPSILVHITEPEVAKSIIASGEFNKVKNGQYGLGSYFAERETQGKIVARHHGAVIVCHVNLGRIYKVNSAELQIDPEELKKQNYDSVRGNYHVGPLYCVFDTKRITPLFASITETNISGVEETYYLIRTDKDIIRLGKIPLNNLIIKLKENQITLSDSDKPPFASIEHKEPALGKREVIFEHRGDFHFENVDIFLNLHPTVLIHFTKPDMAKSIITNGQMLPDPNGVFGLGGYFAENDNMNFKNIKNGAIVVCVVTLGQIFKTENKVLPMKTDELKSHHYDSIQVKTNEGYEYCIFDMARITPLFALINEENENGYYLIRNDERFVRLDKLNLDNIIIKMMENQIIISDGNNQITSISRREPGLIRREVLFVYKGNFCFEKVELFMNNQPSVLINITNPENAKSIITSGKMRSDAKGFYGSGSYFSECEAHGKMKAIQTGAILVCVVSLGQMFKAENKILPMTIEELKGQHYDSVCGSFHTGPEYCVFDSSRVIPLFASIVETNISGAEETYYLIRTNNGPVRLERMPIENLVIRINESEITISDSDKPPFASLTHKESFINEKEVTFVHKGDYLFQKVEEVG